MDGTMRDDQFLIRYGDAYHVSYGALQIGEETFAIDTEENWIDPQNLHHADEFVDDLLSAKKEPVDLSQWMIYPPAFYQELWAAGVTYKRSEEAREAESNKSSVYTRVYNAQRPD